jgi:hypothetical protein
MEMQKKDQPYEQLHVVQTWYHAVQCCSLVVILLLHEKISDFVLHLYVNMIIDFIFADGLLVL